MPLSGPLLPQITGLTESMPQSTDVNAIFVNVTSVIAGITETGLLAQSRLVARNNHALDLARAFIDFSDLRVAEVALERHLLGVAHAAVDLHRLMRDPHRRFGCVQFRDGCLGAEAAAVLLGLAFCERRTQRQQ